MSEEIVVKKKTFSYFFGLIKGTGEEKIGVYTGKVVYVAERWVDGGFRDVLRGCYITLEDKGKLKEIEVAGVSVKQANKLLLKKRVEIKRNLSNEYAEIGFEAIKILKDSLLPK